MASSMDKAASGVTKDVDKAMRGVSRDLVNTVASPLVSREIISGIAKVAASSYA